MKTFSCSCGNRLYFENTRCLTCGKVLGYLPDMGMLSPLVALGDGRWRPDLEGLRGRRYRQCRHYAVENVCNWMIAETDDGVFCRACRLNEAIPNLAKPGNRQAWLRIEKAKRRLIYTLDRLGLPVFGKAADPAHGLAFAFLEDVDDSLEFNDEGGSGRIYTGHLNGTITINLAEADPSTRERVREAMNEQYRTLLGHFRHESGHYYWYRLVATSEWLAPFRALFGDEREDYARSLARYYAAGPPKDWPSRHVSAYAAAHPWEDWAETWAHYLHLVDTLEMARDYELAIHGRPVRSLEATLDATTDLYDLLADWHQLTQTLNALNRSMGQPDAYPFTLTGQAVEKIALVHRLIAASAAG
uniref:Zinc-ribbon domain-containing protein n=1 Tax=Acidihalobacter prosperus TaxID=160660 RepID=A0A1A6C1Q8_9GAMM|nr:putative zinc-binding metallopeptidase [Acidihalobacter prosperus]OBS08501.1 hypothetical protein Thpro_022751 [Acidihalobacter prosperus]